MSHLSIRHDDGFTAVELLITLIVAAMFLFAGYQLYAQVTRDGADANKGAILSNAVYTRLRSEASATTNAPAAAAGCVVANQKTPAIASTPSPENVPGIGNVSYTVEVKCPLLASGTFDVFFVKVTGTYVDGGVSKSVEHAIYVN